MMKDPDHVRQFEDDLARRSPADHAANLAVYEAMWELARKLGALPPADPLEGIDVDVRLARALNARGASGEDRARS